MYAPRIMQPPVAPPRYERVTPQERLPVQERRNQSVTLSYASPVPPSREDETELLQTILQRLTSIEAKLDQLQLSTAMIPSPPGPPVETGWLPSFAPDRQVGKGKTTINDGTLRIRGELNIPLPTLRLYPFGSINVDCTFPNIVVFTFTTPNQRGTAVAHYELDHNAHCLVFDTFRTNERLLALDDLTYPLILIH